VPFNGKRLVIAVPGSSVNLRFRPKSAVRAVLALNSEEEAGFFEIQYRQQCFKGRKKLLL
jgi:hypothetical protein